MVLANPTYRYVVLANPAYVPLMVLAMRYGSGQPYIYNVDTEFLAGKSVIYGEYISGSGQL
jgi:hypothetical protein